MNFIVKETGLGWGVIETDNKVPATEFYGPRAYDDAVAHCARCNERQPKPRFMVRERLQGSRAHAAGLKPGYAVLDTHNFSPIGLIHRAYKLPAGFLTVATCKELDDAKTICEMLNNKERYKK